MTRCEVAANQAAPLGFRKTALAVAALVVAGAVFYVLAFNSGYGYDALEYLVIGRSLNDGYPFHHFVPSKSFGLYYLVAAYLRVAGAEGHGAVALLIASIFALTLATTFAAMLPRFGFHGAMAASALVGLCAAFMELNYLEPEGLVYVGGLMAFVHASRAAKTGRNRHWLLSGVWIGAGCWFKVVSASYLFGVVIFIVCHHLRNRTGIAAAGIAGLAAALGLLAALAAPALYFAATGKWEDHLQWTYLFPLLHRPVDFAAIGKLWTKLLWFDVLLGVCLVFSLAPRLRRRVYAEPDNLLLLLMGLGGCLALLKTSASHYVFPGGALLALYCTRVVQLALAGMPRPRYLIGGAVAALGLLAASAFLYRPSALARLGTLQDFSKEAALAEEIRRRVREGDSALFFRKSTLLYWISHRYPNVPLVNFDVQTSRYLEAFPDTLLAALRDPHLVLVEFSPADPGVQDRAFLATEANRRMLRRFHERLEAEFVPLPSIEGDYRFWARRGQRR